MAPRPESSGPNGGAGYWHLPGSYDTPFSGSRYERIDIGRIRQDVPRTPAQAEALDKLLVEFGGRINVVPSIFVEQDLLVTRLLKRAEIEGRADDNEDTIRTRMRVYHDQTAPLLDYYGARDLLVEIDGDQAIDEVHNELIKVIRASMT